MKPGIISLSCLLLFSVSAACATGLPPAVQAGLDQAGIPNSHVGIVVWPLDRDQPQLALNAEQPFPPASTMKLLTSLAALDLLGPAWHWQTEVWHDGTLHDGTLDGNLYLRGDGDPGFTDERLWLLLHELRLNGLQTVHGDLIIDQSRFQSTLTAPFDDHPLRAYNGAPAATLLDFGSSTVRIDSRNGHSELDVDPLPAGTRLDNRIHVDHATCGDWRERIHTGWQPGAGVLRFDGDWSDQCPPAQFAVTLHNPSALLGPAFITGWQQQGGTIDGTWREGTVAPDAQLLVSFPSLPLTTLLGDMNKFSNNVMARNLFLSLATDTPATPASAEAAVQHWLQLQGLPMPGLVIDNGSGLSRSARISPLDMARLLRQAARSALWPEFAASLPIVAVDGTMRHRLRDTPVAGHAHVKTGTLTGVKTIAGYVTLADGRRVVVVFFIDDAHAADGAAAQEALLSAIYSGLPE